MENEELTYPRMPTGFSECKPYLSEEEISNFFDRAVRNRIGIRLIAEQHLAYSFLTARQGKTSGGRNTKDSSQIGVVDTKCTPSKIVRACGYHVETLCEGAYGIGKTLICGVALNDAKYVLPSQLLILLSMEIAKHSSHTSLHISSTF
jgi:26S proteasome regulatory subunit T1